MTATALFLAVLLNLWAARPMFRGYLSFALFVTAGAWLGYVLRDRLRPGGMDAAYEVWSQESAAMGAQVIIIAMVAFACGAQAAAWALPTPSRHTRPPGDACDSPLISGTASVRRVARYQSIGYAIVFAWVLSKGIGQIVSRSGYFVEGALPVLEPATGSLLPVAFLIGCLGRFSRQRGATLLMLTVALCAFATASRLMALLPLLFLFVAYMQGRLNKRILIGCLIATWIGLALALELRESDQGHGLFPYLQQSADFSTLERGNVKALSNTLFSVPLAGFVALHGRFSAADLVVSLNPLPGALTDWPAIWPRLRVHQFIPYSGLGEMAALSPWVLIAGLATLGVVAYVCVYLAQARSGLVAVLLVALPFMPLALLFQYNLRSSARLVYFVVIIVLIVSMAGAKPRRRVHSPTPANANRRSPFS
jgi:hypothetical protein